MNYKDEEWYKDIHNAVHDCLVDILNKKPTGKQISLVIVNIPTRIMNLAYEWGWNDTEVRDSLYNWTRKYLFSGDVDDEE